MFSLPRLDEVGPQDKTDDETDDGQKGACLGKACYGVHFETMLFACQIIAGNSFETAYLSYDRKGNNRVQLAPCGILMHDHYFLHVPQGEFIFPSPLYIISRLKCRFFRHSIIREFVC